MKKISIVFNEYKKSVKWLYFSFFVILTNLTLIDNFSIGRLIGINLAWFVISILIYMGTKIK